MATLAKRRPENLSGDLYVDSTCIDCDTCRWMAPLTFTRENGQSVVSHQPNNDSERQAALQALLACPTASIGTVDPPHDIKAVQASIPVAITETVYHCGYHSEQSFGAASYLIQRPEGNVLVDSPRFTPPLVKRLEAMGGIRYLYLTHKDDVADHEKLHRHFGCDRLLHHDDLTASTQSIEHVLEGTEAIALAADLTIIPVPGHTKGHTVLHYHPEADDSVLFTGDHLAWSAPMQQLYAFRRHCWYSWAQQIESMKTLLDYSFMWVLPGHGRRFHAQDPAQMRQQLHQCIDWMTVH